MPVAGTANPFGLTLERELGAVYDTEIAKFWDERGHARQFMGAKNVPIVAMLFPNPDSDVGVVISSGRTESFIKYKELIYDLWRQGFSVYIHDHRGQGFSGRMLPDKPEMGHVEDFDDYVADLKIFVDTVIRPAGHKALALLAHSMGGAVASLYLQRHGGDFRVAVMSSPMHEPKTGRISDRLACGVLEMKDWIGRDKEYAPGKGPYDLTESFDSDNGLTHSDVRYAIIKREYEQNPAARLGGPSIGWVCQACVASRSLRGDADKIGIPILVLQAGADKVVTPEGQLEFCEKLNRSQRAQGRPDLGRLEVIEGARHELFIEADQFRIPAVSRAIEFIRAVAT